MFSEVSLTLGPLVTRSHRQMVPFVDVVVVRSKRFHGDNVCVWSVPPSFFGLLKRGSNSLVL